MRSTRTVVDSARFRWRRRCSIFRAAATLPGPRSDSRVSRSDSEERGSTLVRDAGAANALDERLALAGMSDDEVRRKSRMFARASAALARRPTLSLWVPGRIEFLGKHTDYAGGRSLVCAVVRGFVVAAAARDDRLVRITDAVSNEQVE